MPDQVPVQRVRIQYEVGYPLQYSGQLDLQSVWERTLRRAGLPMAYSQGFNPQPRLHLACALPLGFMSQCELVDFWQKEHLPVAHIRSSLEGKQQPGIRIINVAEVPLDLPALQTTILSAEYTCELVSLESQYPLQEEMDRFLSQEQIIRERRGKSYNLRPLVIGLRMHQSLENQPPLLWMELKTQEGATGRPDEVLLALGVDPFSTRITRITLHRRKDT